MHTCAFHFSLDMCCKDLNDKSHLGIYFLCSIYRGSKELIISTELQRVSGLVVEQCTLSSCLLLRALQGEGNQSSRGETPEG